MANEPEWQRVARAGNIVAAIKLYRFNSGVGLAEAKRAVEDWLERNCPPTPEYQVAYEICNRLDTRLTAYLSKTASSIAYLIRLAGASEDREGLFKLVTNTCSSGLDLVVEVLVPGARVSARNTIRSLLESGVRAVWLLEPEVVSLSVATEPGQWMNYYDEYVYIDRTVLPGFSCKVSALFG